MSSYIGKVQVESGDEILIGSTLYGVCDSNIAASTAAKVVTLADFDTLMRGVTVHVRFVNGNTVTTGVTLKVGSTTAYPVNGNCVCNPNDVIAFTYWEDSSSHIWYANTNIVAEEGTGNGQIKINGNNINVHGLGSAAYTNTAAYATSAQGALAEAAMPKTGGEFTGPISIPAVSDSSTTGTVATVDYVREKTAGLSGLSGAMHYKGISSTTITDGGTENPTVGGNVITVKEGGDVILYDNKEFVWNETNWEILGDEGSYVLKTSITATTIGSASGWSSGTASSASVTGGILKLTNSTAPTLTVTTMAVVIPAT